MLHKANSSSCGRSQPISMLSGGRRRGRTKPLQNFSKGSQTRKLLGTKHSKVVGQRCRGSRVNNSCSSVVPVRQWPMMKIGSPGSLTRSPRSARRGGCLQRPGGGIENAEQEVEQAGGAPMAGGTRKRCVPGGGAGRRSRLPSRCRHDTRPPWAASDRRGWYMPFLRHALVRWVEQMSSVGDGCPWGSSAEASCGSLRPAATETTGISSLQGWNYHKRVYSRKDRGCPPRWKPRAPW